MEKRLDNPLAFEGLSRRFPFYRLLVNLTDIMEENREVR